MHRVHMINWRFDLKKKFLLITSVCVISTGIILGGCDKREDTFVDAYDYIGFMEQAEDGSQTRPSENLAALAVDGQFSKYRVLIQDGKPYLDINGIKGYVDDRFYWEKTDNKVLFTNATVTYSVAEGDTILECSDGTSQELGYEAVICDSDKCYVSMELVDQFDDIDYEYFKSDDTNVPSTMRLEYASGEYKRAKATKENSVRTKDDVANAVIVKVAKDDVITILEDKGDWYKAQTDSGFVGYVEKKYFEDAYTDNIERENDDATYSHLTMDGKVKLAWHQVTGYASSEMFLDVTKDVKGINVISPTWFSVIDDKGNIDNYSSTEYVDSAHAKGLKVWVLADDFKENEEGSKYINRVIATADGRANLISNLVAGVINCGADGLNIDFEYISAEQGDSYRQFLRELSIQCRNNGIVLSVDNYVPSDWSDYYGMEYQSNIADYIIVMSYDEFTSGSKVAGPVASISFVEKAVKDTIEKVGDSSRVVMGIPFYTRVWKETPEEFVADGSEIIEDSVNGNYALSSEAVTMDTAKESYTSMGASPMWNEETGTNYVYYEYNNIRYMMWLEDKDSLDRKLEVASQYDVGGIACWKLTLENKEVWTSIEAFN